MPKKLDHTAACEHLSRVDRRLASIIARSGACRLQQETTQSIFEALLESIIYQQLNGKAAAVAPAACKTSPNDQILALGKKLHITGTPTIFFTDGSRAPGAMDGPALEEKFSSLQ